MRIRVFYTGVLDRGFEIIVTLHAQTRTHELVCRSNCTLLRGGQTHTHTRTAQTAEPTDRPPNPLALLSLLAQYSSFNVKAKPPHGVAVAPAADADNLIH